MTDSKAAPRVTLRLTQTELENHCRPAVDVLFRSAPPIFGPRILAVILTGMGSDGLLGCRLIRERGGTILAQDEPSSAIWGMPGAVAQAGLAHRVLRSIRSRQKSFGWSADANARPSSFENRWSDHGDKPWPCAPQNGLQFSSPAGLRPVPKCA